MDAENKYSFETGIKNSFQPLDYVLFAGVLAVSTGIGVFYAIKDRNTQTTQSFLLAGGHMNIVPVSMSLLASFISSITLLGTPAEMYNYGTMYWWIGLSYIFTVAAAAHIYIPIFFRLKITSVYEYLELRFCKSIRTFGTCIYTFHMVTYMSIVLYGPSLALNAVTGLSLWGAAFSVGTVCTLYTAIGGMKAVLWTDTFQVVMMVAGVLASIIQSSINMGGFSKVWQTASDNKRIDFQEFGVDPRIRHSVWSLLIGGGSYWLTIYGVNQAQIQRVLTCKDLKDAQRAMWINFPGLFILLSLCCIVGLALYAFYSNCDPVTFKLIMASDQLYPLFVMDIMGHVPGIPGLFVSSIFSGALSTISSGLNSLSAVWLQDIVKPYIAPNISEKHATIFTKCIAFVFGACCMGFAYLASYLGDMLQAAIAVGGVFGGAMLGLFTLAMIFPWANKWGAFSGLLSGIGILGWISLGAHLNKSAANRLPVHTYGCNWNLTVTRNSSSSIHSIADLNSTDDFDSSSYSRRGPGDIYSLSYLWYTPIAVIIVVSVGLLVSFISGRQDPLEVDPRLICPVVDVVFPCLPEKFRKPFRFGINHEGKYDIKPTKAAIPLATHNEEVEGHYLNQENGHVDALLS